MNGLDIYLCAICEKTYTAKDSPYCAVCKENERKNTEINNLIYDNLG